LDHPASSDDGRVCGVELTYSQQICAEHYIAHCARQFKHTSAALMMMMMMTAAAFNSTGVIMTAAAFNSTGVTDARQY
jgi:hypothetical protein